MAQADLVTDEGEDRKDPAAAMGAELAGVRRKRERERERDEMKGKEMKSD